ncbi:hypothetical protein MYMAC_000994 [Corallococcus macrosporus DSM 14697]|uniref:Uncharacterized protein n=1 Tax=Corallococcus macrosporus DSM 14697 TaxID=1189310 RepID=A0A250JNG5_9BACT|nr:hypothetical protein MYMAC_000994 [Corallococcus macrosporus DSM 14697]
MTEAEPREALTDMGVHAYFVRSIQSGLRLARWPDNLGSDLQGVQTMRLEEQWLPGQSKRPRPEGILPLR